MTALLQLCQSLLMEQILAMFEIDLIAVEEATKPHLHRKFKTITKVLWCYRTTPNRSFLMLCC